VFDLLGIQIAGSRRRLKGHRDGSTGPSQDPMAPSAGAP
jgi:hypothetical protein